MQRRSILKLGTLGTVMVIVALAVAFFAQDARGSAMVGGISVSTGQTSGPWRDSDPQSPVEVMIPEAYRPATGLLAPLATPSPDTHHLYFTPQDENTTATVLFLYNTSTMTASIAIEGYNLTGSRVLNTALSLPAGNLVRIVSDDVEPIGSWDDSVLVNFRTTTTYAKLTLPLGVKAEGYVAYNGTGPYSPLESTPLIPLRFSTDPATVFLPNVLTSE